SRRMDPAGDAAGRVGLGAGPAPLLALANVPFRAAATVPADPRSVTYEGARGAYAAGIEVYASRIAPGSSTIQQQIHLFPQVSDSDRPFAALDHVFSPLEDDMAAVCWAGWQ